MAYIGSFSSEEGALLKKLGAAVLRQTTRAGCYSYTIGCTQHIFGHFFPRREFSNRTSCEYACVRCFRETYSTSSPWWLLRVSSYLLYDPDRSVNRLHTTARTSRNEGKVTPPVTAGHENRQIQWKPGRLKPAHSDTLTSSWTIVTLSLLCAPPLCFGRLLTHTYRQDADCSCSANR